MSQNDFNIANQTFPNTRADINSALQALATQSSGGSAPGTTYPYQFWYNTSNNTLSIRDGANASWIALMVFDQSNKEYALRNLREAQAKDADGIQIKGSAGVVRATLASSTYAADFEGAGRFTGQVEVAEATSLTSAVTAKQVDFAAPVSGVAYSASATSVSATTGSLTAPCKGTAVILIDAESGASPNNPIITANTSIGAATMIGGGNSYSAVATRAMTAGQSATFTGALSNSNSSWMQITVRVLFFPNPV